MKLAAIDIGSNAVRLQIVRATNDLGSDRFKKIEFLRIPVRLGDDAFKNKKISKEKRKIFFKAMQAFKLVIDAFEVDYYMACATSAMREATNGEKIIQRVKEDFGLKIDIIDGKRESELILSSIDHVFEANKNYLTIDVGGGSTEMTVIKNKKVLNAVSFNIGTVRLMDGAVTENTWLSLENWVKINTKGLSDLEAVVTSGTINKISNIINSDASDGEFTRDQLKIFHRKVSKMAIEERVSQLKLNPDRADIIELSADIYLRILNWSNIIKIKSPENSGLKDGIINELFNTYQFNIK